ncbi:hypothetical protein YC2023_015334 [Brassica napus]
MNQLVSSPSFGQAAVRSLNYIRPLYAALPLISAGLNAASKPATTTVRKFSSSPVPNINRLKSPAAPMTQLSSAASAFVRNFSSNSSASAIVDPKLASYGVENPVYAVVQLAQTTMRSELGKITLDKTFEERDTLNEKIVEAINVAAKHWGLECLRYEIKDIMPPNGVKVAMEMQAEAERRKRAQILESEGTRQAHINIADGKKSSVILESEAAKMDQVNRASGEAEAILARAQATARGLTLLSQSIKETGGVEAASLRVAEKYIEAFGNIAKEGTTMLLPSSAENPANMIAQALTMYKSLVPKSALQETLALESSDVVT